MPLLEGWESRGILLSCEDRLLALVNSEELSGLGLFSHFVNVRSHFCFHLLMRLELRLDSPSSCVSIIFSGQLFTFSQHTVYRADTLEKHTHNDLTRPKIQRRLSFLSAG